MFFYLPTKIYSERDCVKKYAGEWTALGRHALIVTGKSSARNGALADVTEALKQSGTAYTIYDQIEENPSVETVMQVRKLGIAQQADFVIGIGGGSPMDAAKAIALMIANKNQGADFLYRKASAQSVSTATKGQCTEAAGQSVSAATKEQCTEASAESVSTATEGQCIEAAGHSTLAATDVVYKSEQEFRVLPVVEVPTTCGTGSEATPYAILTVHEKRTKMSIAHRIFPAFALIDGKYIKNAPRSLIVNTAVDALGHYIESYINSNATDFSRMLCTYGMDLWSSCKNILIGAPARDQELDRLMMASAIAGMAISHTGTALPHGLSYYLTYEKGIPHGKAVGCFLPGYLAQSSSLISRRVLQLAGFPDQQYFRSFLHQLIGRAEMDDDLMAQAVAGMMANPAKLKNTPFPVTEEMLYQICRAAV